jgi:hypothetical protein
VRFDHGGKTYEFSDTDMTLPACRAVKQHLGMTYGEWAAGLRAQTLDVDAMLAMVYTAKRRDGEAVSWEDLEAAFSPNDLLLSIAKHLKAQAVDAGVDVSEINLPDDLEDAADEKKPKQTPRKPRKTRAATS